VLQPPPDPQAAGADYRNLWVVRSRPDAPATARRSLERRITALCGIDCTTGPVPLDLQRPAEIATLDRVRLTPVVLAGVLAALAIATVGQTLVTSIRRRRRDLAVLKTLGFLRSQVSAAVAWQATTFAAVAALIGLPLGVMLGRLTWRVLGDQLGIVPDPVTPALQLLVAFPASILLANLMAVVPGLLAGRVPPALALRAE
jgi:predicted lysophospholipase L1 biosynthesis ABC-type transport system permease subunit